jgi:Zn-dependent protease with chaperone function
VASLKPVARRTAILLLSWLGFYFLGAVMALGLLFIPYAQIAYGKSLDFGGILAGIGGVWVAWAFLPLVRAQRVDRDRPLRDGEHRALRELVHDVARRAGYPPPDEIHLLSQANAHAYLAKSWPRKGPSVVGIGLPLLAWLDHRGIEAVIAHEIGHHIAGDTRLGPWVYRTRRSIGRAIENLEGANFLLHLPFVLYGEAFMKYSLSVSREQELSADALSLQIAGKGAVATALVQSEEHGSLWGAYLATEVIPILEKGFLPPLLEGWHLFQTGIAKATESASAEEKARNARFTSDEPRDDDTHPTLPQRLTALGAERADARPGETSLDLLDDVGKAEETVLRGLFVREDTPVEGVSWRDVAAKVWLPLWQELVHEHGALAALKVHDLPQVLKEPMAWAQRTRHGLAILSPAAEKRRLMHLLGSWLCVKLEEEGFAFEALPGAPVRARRDALDIEPFNVVRALDDGDVSNASWAALQAALPRA